MQRLVRLCASRAARAVAALGPALLVVGPVAAQANTHFGVEPNDTKAQATLVEGIQPGEIIETSFPFPSYFRIRAADAPQQVYRYELWSPGSLGEMHVRGRAAQTDAVDPTSDLSLAMSGSVQSFDGFLAWYGFGKSEEVLATLDIYALVGGRFPNPTPARADFVMTAVTERDLGAVAELPLDLVVRPLTGSQDLELHVFDAEFNALPYAALDESAPGALEVRLPFEAPPGLYHVAVTDHEAASHLPPSALDFAATSGALDFAGAFVCGSRARFIDVELAVEPRGGGAPLARGTATKLLAYEALWFRVQIGQGQSYQSFCRGDGSAATCGCLGDAPPRSGMGCLNSTGRGATALALDHVQRGLWRVTLEDLPAHTFALGFVGLQAAAPTQAFGGLACIAPGAVRVGPAQADAAGTAVIPAYDPMASGFLAGQTLYLQAAYRDAVAPAACAVNFTSGFSFLAR